MTCTSGLPVFHSERPHTMQLSGTHTTECPGTYNSLIVR